MANNKSAIKRISVNSKKRLVNKSAKSSLRTVYKKSMTAIVSDPDNNTETIKNAYKKIDQAAAKGIIHKNTAARRKSLIMKRASVKA